MFGYGKEIAKLEEQIKWLRDLTYDKRSWGKDTSLDGRITTLECEIGNLKRHIEDHCDDDHDYYLNLFQACPNCDSTMLKETRFIPDVVPGGFNTGKTKAIRFFYCGCCGKFEVVEGTEQEVATALGRSTAGDGLDFSGPEITD